MPKCMPTVSLHLLSGRLFKPSTETHASHWVFLATQSLWCILIFNHDALLSGAERRAYVAQQDIKAA